MSKNYQPATDAVVVTVAGQTFFAGQKLFSTGSRGFYGNGKAVVEVGSENESDLRRYQVAITITEIGSKGTVTETRPVVAAPVDPTAPRLAPAKQ